MKQKLGYIDHSFHKKTKSTYFLRDILADNFEVIDIWDESWNGGDVLSAEFINSQNFEYVLFFQSFLPISELKKIKAKIIWVPMYDGVVGLGDYFWMELPTLPIKIVSFSKTLSHKMRDFGLDVLNVQYFFDPKKFRIMEDFNEIRIFLWQRTDISFKHIKKLLGDQKIGKIILKLDIDPGYEAYHPTNADIKKYNIEIARWLDSKDDYFKALDGCNIFISPRKFEGIGMSFIEAMAMGMAVVAHDNPTMNEYINNKINGYLFDYNDLKEINFQDIRKISANSRKYCEEGYNKWKEDSNKIVNFVLSDLKDPVVLTSARLFYVKMAQIEHAVLKKIGLILRYCKVKNL